MIKLTDHQQQKHDKIKTFLARGVFEADITSFVLVLSGAAGTGKTTLTKQVADYARSNFNWKIVGVAPTHKARRVLSSILNQGTFLQIETITVAALLNKIRSHSYIGTNRYVRDGSSRLDSYDLFIIDEVSMITNKDYDEIVNLAKKYRKKLIFIGDKMQIPNPSQVYTKRDNVLVKPDNKAFQHDLHLELEEVIRQGKSNPLLSIYNSFRECDYDHLVDISRENQINAETGEGVEFTTDHDYFREIIKQRFHQQLTAVNSALLDLKVIAYTNNNVREYNNMIRKELGFTQPYQPGEVMMGYQNIRGVIENGQEYIIKANNFRHDVSVFCNSNIRYSGNSASFHGLVGNMLELTDTDKVSRKVFLPQASAPENSAVLHELVRRAERVNARGSSKSDFRDYIILKSKLLFIDNLYRFNGAIMSEKELTAGHPLLFTQVKDTVEERDGKRIMLNTTQVQQLNSHYPDLILNRLKDSKTIADNELFADRFMILEKDLDYGYAITAHKSQGSTYREVFIDETDFNRIKDCWNFRYKLRENRIKERNQLLYVAYTRTSHKLWVYYK